MLKQVTIFKSMYYVEHHNVLCHVTCLPKTSLLFHSKNIAKTCQK